MTPRERPKRVGQRERETERHTEGEHGGQKETIERVLTKETPRERPKRVGFTLLSLSLSLSG